jgi:hypothetical protein
MALYKYAQYITKSEDKAFDVEYAPGAVPPHSGVYRCGGCGKEIVAEHERQFPPQNHHQHSAAQGAIRWRMAVFADHNPK